MLHQCSSYLWKTTNTPTLNGEGGGGGRGERRAVWILLFPEVTQFEYNVSTILSSVVDLSTTEKSWQSKPGNSLMEPLRPFPSQSYTLVNLMETQEGQKVPVEVVNSIISESLDRKCTNSLTYYKQKKQKGVSQAMIFPGVTIKEISIHDLIYVKQETLQWRLAPLFCLNPCSHSILVLKN